MVSFLRRWWLPVAVVVALAIGGFAVERLHGIFPIVTSSKPDPKSKTPPQAPKSAIYEVFGPPGTAGVVNWMDEKTQPQREDFATLPWKKTITGNVPGLFAYVVAQGDSDSIGCRIIVNDQVVDEHLDTGLNAAIACLDKSA